MSVRLYMNVYDVGLNPQEGVELSISPSGNPMQVSGMGFIANNVVALSNISGYVYADVMENCQLRVKIPKMHLDYFILTPGSGEIDLASLI